MKKRWEPQAIELHFYDQSPEHEKHVLDQLTDILYSYFSQLELKSRQARTTDAVSQPTREDR